MRIVFLLFDHKTVPVRITTQSVLCVYSLLFIRGAVEEVKGKNWFGRKQLFLMKRMNTLFEKLMRMYIEYYTQHTIYCLKVRS